MANSQIIKLHTGPVIIDMLLQHRKDNLNEIENSEKNIWLAGDSPGFCSKYCTCSVIDLHRSKIINFNLVQKGMGSGDLNEKLVNR